MFVCRSGCGPEKGPVCTLVCDSKVVGVSGHASSTELCVVVVLEDGKLQLFQVDLGQGEESVAMGKAVMPASTLQFVRNSEQVCMLQGVLGGKGGISGIDQCIN